MPRSVKKGPFVDQHLLKKVAARPRRRAEASGHQDLVAPLDDHARDRRPHLRRAQRPQVHPGVRHREHGRPQARRVLARRAPSTATAAATKKAASLAASQEAIDATASAASRMSPRKMRVVANLVRGKQVEEALGILDFMPKTAARADREGRSSRPPRTPRTSRAASVDVDDLYVQTITVDGGPIVKRWMPRAMGRATRINHRTSHLTVVVSDERRTAEPWARRLIRSASASASSRRGTRKWYEEKNYAQVAPRGPPAPKGFIKKKLNHAGISHVEIERAANKVQDQHPHRAPGHRDRQARRRHRDR